jgi:uncharacterized protein
VRAGDIGDRGVLERLARIAPVTAVRGNNDRGAWARVLRETEVLQAGKIRIYVIHDAAALAPDPVAGGLDVAVAKLRIGEASVRFELIEL